MPDFNLHVAISDVLRETELTDPSEIAREVHAHLSPEEREAALVQALRPFVTDVIRLERHVEVPRQSSASPGRSRKVAGIRDKWREEKLRSRLQVGGVYKMLRDCTRDDLIAAATERREIAAANVAAAERYEKLAAALSSDEATVSEVDAATLADVFGRVAA